MLDEGFAGSVVSMDVGECVAWGKTSSEVFSDQECHPGVSNDSLRQLETICGLRNSGLCTFRFLKSSPTRFLSLEADKANKSRVARLSAKPLASWL